ncbi:hypothetical protein GCM10009555_032670 [Acrocarpospora macrocephala]|uniref:Uncharacterized protein n=1 Tax=Acrocarpospora macrocephala TaxID=150177 RepID=A0A5M3WJ80_9ACTN|nr:hypothetical protein [Acrocarpospora macrocephala]GES06448.1 hypothetical protein Amac_000430 [Acrocarpospora macrocephala]
MNDQVSVEVLPLRVDAAGTWRYRRLLTPLGGESPDQAARRGAGVRAGDASTVVHSTSWRYRPQGQIVLTYAICPDPDPHLPATELETIRLARGATPSSPTPEHVHLENVVAHALRHLAYLLEHDPVVGAALSGDIAVARALNSLSREPAEAFIGAH